MKRIQGTVLAFAATLIGTLSGNTSYAQSWDLTGNFVAGDVLGSLNAADLDIITGNTTRVTIAAGGDLYVLNNVGIGTTNPQNRVDVNGQMVIGSTYAGSTTAPTNSLLVQGEIGIGYTTNPGTYRLYTNGNTWTNGGYFGSDARWKEHVTTIGGALAKVMQLRGVTYDFKHADYPQINFPEGRQVGFIAQEMEKVVPELVITNNDGYKGVAYQNLTAVLTEAIKEQQQMIRTLTTRITTLEAALGISSGQESSPKGPSDLR